MKSHFKKSLIPLYIVLILIASGVYIVTNSAEQDDYIVKTSADIRRLTVIIDPGHGGADGGAVSLSGVCESTVNLDIAVRLDQILGFFGTHVEMTRETEQLDYSAKADTIREKKAEDQTQRLKLINSTENAVLLSIHQNLYPDSGPFGAQVLYSRTNGSKQFAESMQRLLISALNTKNRRTVSKVPDNILLMNHITCPAILIECGFLSNPAEEKLLMTDTYRLKVAAVIAGGYLSGRYNLTDINSGGENEGKDNILLH